MLSHTDEEKKETVDPLQLVLKYKDYSVTVNTGIKCLEEKKYPEAMDLFQQAVLTNPHISIAYSGIAKTKEMLSRLVTGDDQKAHLESALLSYTLAIKYTPFHTGCREASIKIQKQLNRKTQLEAAELAKFIKLEQDFTFWHRKELAKYHPGALFTEKDSQDAFYGFSALEAGHLESAYFCFERAIQRRQFDVYAWCGIAEITSGTLDINNEDLASSSQILNYLIHIYKHPMAYAVRAIIQYNKGRHVLASDDVIKCIEHCPEDTFDYLKRIDDKLLLAYHQLPPETAQTKLAELKDYRYYLKKTPHWLAAGKYAEVFTLLSFCRWRLNLEASAAIPKPSESLREQLSLVYHLRFEASVWMGKIQQAIKDLSYAKIYTKKEPELRKKVSAFLQKRVSDANKLSDYDKSVELMRLAIDEDPHNGNLYIDIAAILAKVENFALARRYLHEALLHAPQNKTRIDLLMKNFRKQADSLAESKLKKEDNYKFLNFQQHVIKAHAEYSKRLEYHQQPIPAPLDAFSLRNTYKAIEAPDLLVAIKFCNDALRHCPVDFVALTRRAEIFLAQKNLAAALADINNIINLWRYSPAYWLRAKYHSMRQETERMRADYIKCITSSRPSPLHDYKLTAEIVSELIGITPKEDIKGQLSGTLGTALDFLSVFSGFTRSITSESRNGIWGIVLPGMTKIPGKKVAEEKNPAGLNNSAFHNGNIDILKIQLQTTPLNAEAHHYVAINYENVDDYDMAMMHVSLALWLEAKENIGQLYLRARLNILLDNIPQAYSDVLELNNLIRLDNAGKAPTDNYFTPLEVLMVVFRKAALKAFEKKQYAKAATLYECIFILNEDKDVQAEIAKCLKAGIEKSQEFTQQSATPKIVEIPSEETPALKAVIEPVVKARSALAAPPSKPTFNVTPAKPKITQKLVVEKEEAQPKGEGLALLAAERLSQLDAKRAREKEKQKKRLQSKRDEKLAKRHTEKDANVEASPTSAVNFTVINPAPAPTGTEATATTTAIQTLLKKTAVVERPKYEADYFRRFVPKKISLPGTELAARMFLYLKELAAREKINYLSYIVGGAVVDWMLMKYFANLQAEYAKNPTEELAAFIQRPMFNRCRENKIHIDDIDWVTELPLPLIEIMASYFNLNPISQPHADVRSYTLGNTKIDFMHRPSLAHLDKEVALRVNGSLYMRWDQIEAEDYSFDVKDPSYKGLSDLCLGRLRAVEPEETYKDPVKVLYMLFQETKRNFVIDEHDQVTIKRMFPDVEYEDEVVLNAQIKKLFSFFTVTINYPKLMEYKIFSGLFSPYFDRCLNTDADWIKEQMKSVNTVPFPRLKRIYAIFIVSIAMQELTNQICDERSRGFLFVPQSVEDLTVGALLSRCSNVISRFRLLNSYFANHIDGDIKHHFYRFFMPLISNWTVQHDHLRYKGFFSSFAVPPRKDSQIEGLFLLTNTATDGLYARPASP